MTSFFLRLWIFFTHVRTPCELRVNERKLVLEEHEASETVFLKAAEEVSILLLFEKIDHLHDWIDELINPRTYFSSELKWC